MAINEILDSYIDSLNDQALEALLRRKVAYKDAPYLKPHTQLVSLKSFYDII